MRNDCELIMSFTLQFVGVEGFVTAIVDLFPQHLRRGHRKELFIALCSVFWFLIGLSMVTEVITIILLRKNLYINYCTSEINVVWFQGGMYVFQLFDSYSASGSALLWVSLFQSVAVGWIYGK